MNLAISSSFAKLCQKPNRIPDKISQKQYSKIRIKNELRFLYVKKQHLALLYYKTLIPMFLTIFNAIHCVL